MRISLSLASPCANIKDSYVTKTGFVQFPWRPGLMKKYVVIVYLKKIRKPIFI